MRNKKILYFDYWTVGLKNFKLFDQELKDCGFETKLLHLNSWKGIDGPDYQEIDNISSYDIRYYNTNLLYKVLELEMPLALVMLNVNFIADRAINLGCKKLGIKCVYFMHGDIMRDEFKEETVPSMNRKNNQIQKIKKAIKQFKPVTNFLYSTWRYNRKYFLRLHPYEVLLRTFFNPGAYMFFPPATFDIKPDMALVYGELDKKFLARKYNDDLFVKVVGNPDLDAFFKEEPFLAGQKDFFFQQSHIPLNKPYVTYIEEGTVENNLWTNEDRMEFVNEISAICKEMGYLLVIKLHPRTIKGPNRTLFNNLENTIVIEQTDFSKLIYFTEVCISHYSTALIFPMLLDKPIVVPRWGRSANMLTLNSSKEVTFVRTLDEFRSRIKAMDFSYERKEYLNDNVPFRDGKTYKRVANHIIDLIR